ncbi:MAG: hypothetical protein IPK26_23870 [Planctomycetes bacterium]|nr:hypothetical protein [Planctomycetota bacterium]
MAAAPEEELARACAAFAGERLLELAEAVAAVLGEAVPLRVDWSGIEGVPAVARVGAFVGDELVPAFSWLRAEDRRLLLHLVDRIDIRFAVSARGRVIRCINEALVIGLPPDAVVPEWPAATLCRLLELDLDAEVAPVLAHVQSRVATWEERCGGGRWLVDWVGFTGHTDPRQTVLALHRLAAFVDQAGSAMEKRPGQIRRLVLVSATTFRGQFVRTDERIDLHWDLDLTNAPPSASTVVATIENAQRDAQLGR